MSHVTVALPIVRNSGDLIRLDYAFSNFKPDAIHIIGTPDERQALMDHGAFEKIGCPITVGPLVGDVILLAPVHGREPGLASIVDFEHPAEAVYVLGGDRKDWKDELDSATIGSRVYIPTDTKDDMWSDAAWCVTMWDRRMKHG